MHQYIIKHRAGPVRFAVTQNESRETLVITAAICNIWIFPLWAWQSRYLSQPMCRGPPARPRHSWPTAAARTDRFLQQSNDASQVYLISPWYPFGFRICPYSSWLPALWERHRVVWDGPGRKLPVRVCLCVCVCVFMHVCVWAVQWSIGKLCQLTCSEWASTAEHLQQLHRQELWNCWSRCMKTVCQCMFFFSYIFFSFLYFYSLHVLISQALISQSLPPICLSSILTFMKEKAELCLYEHNACFVLLHL